MVRFSPFKKEASNYFFAKPAESAEKRRYFDNPSKYRKNGFLEFELQTFIQLGLCAPLSLGKTKIRNYSTAQ